ncbi:MAG TPA: iron-sulfur cluster assembly scaffold protein [Gammaproteobacteria bacterium]
MDYGPEVERRFASAEGLADLVPEASGTVATGEAEDRTLNVWVRFQVQMLHGTIRAVRFQVYGCPHTIAAASWIADRLHGKPPEALTEVDLRRLERELDVPVEKLGKLLRIEDALAACAERLGVSGPRSPER